MPEELESTPTEPTSETPAEGGMPKDAGSTQTPTTEPDEDESETED